MLGGLSWNGTSLTNLARIVGTVLGVRALRRPEGIGTTLRPDLGNASVGKRERGAIITAAAVS